MIIDLNRIPKTILFEVEDAGIDLDKWEIVDFNHDSITFQNKLTCRKAYWRY